MRFVRPLYIPSRAADYTESGSLILRDGSTAAIRPAEPTDVSLMQQFVDRLSPESRHHRFFSETSPSSDSIATICNSSSPSSQFTLVVTRIWEGTLRIIASGSYWARDNQTAEVAMAVDDRFHGRGLGTLLLERLALSAIRQGFIDLWAMTHVDNLAMREVFRESGFTAREFYDGDDMEVELSLIPTETSVTRVETRERLSTVASLRSFFQPHAIAIIGASRDPKKIGYRVLDSLTTCKYRGCIYPVNPYATSIQGIQAYPTVFGIPEPIDLAIIAVPRDCVLPVIEDCAAKGIRAVMIITAGFAEVGPKGILLQQQMLVTIRQHGMRMIGPNCLGIMNTDPDIQLNASFTTSFPIPGRTAMSSQSGAIGIVTLSRARQLSLGISSFVSVGNKADVSTNDLLQYWEEDPATDVILLYIESFGNPRRFARIAQRVSRRKPIIAVKAGRSQPGRRAASSHTAALATAEVAVDALFRQSGVIRVESLDELLSVAAGLSTQPLPAGRRVAIITNAGGPAILCADACEAGALAVPELSATTKTMLASFLPFDAALSNPVDLIASATPDQYAKTIELLLSTEEIDALIILYISVTVRDTSAIANSILMGIENGRRASAVSKPVFIGWMAEGDMDRTFKLQTETIPTYRVPESPSLVLSKAASYRDWLDQPPGLVPEFDDVDIAAARQVCAHAISQRGAGWLTTEETLDVLNAMHLPLQPGGVARTAVEAVSLASKLGFPVCVKLASHQLVHKTEVGGVHLNLVNEEAVRTAFTLIEARLDAANQSDAMDGVLVQSMAATGMEVMVGVMDDPLFGPLISFGLGGIHVEILGDVQFRIIPLTERDASEMIKATKGYSLLRGYRGQPPTDISALEELLLRVSRLIEEVSAISELDLNPIFTFPPGQGCRIVDARIRVVMDTGLNAR